MKPARAARGIDARSVNASGTSRGRQARFELRTADPSDARQLYALIQSNIEEGHLLPRTLDELLQHAPRFTVAVRSRRIQGRRAAGTVRAEVIRRERAPETLLGCAELAPLSPSVAEVRSLAVDRSARGAGIGRRIVEELRRRARREGFDRLCAFTHRPDYFLGMSFSIVPHHWFPEKIFTDCVKCPLFRRCGQYAMVVPLEIVRDEPAEPVLLEQS